MWGQVNGGFPYFGTLDEGVGLAPKFDFTLVSEVPAVSNDAVFVGGTTGEVGGLHWACDGWEGWGDGGGLALLGEG